MFITSALFAALISIMFLGSSAVAFSEMLRESRESDPPRTGPGLI